MSHFGRTGPPDIRDTYSLLVLNITFRTTADDLFPLFDKYGKVVDIFIPRDRRTGDSRGFAFVRYKYGEEAQKAVERLDVQGVEMIEIETTEGEVVAEAGAETTVKGTAAGKGILAIEAGAAVQVRITAKAVVVEGMIVRGREVEAGQLTGKNFASPARRSLSPRKSQSPRRTPPSRGASPVKHNHDERSPTSGSASPRRRPVTSRSPSPHKSDADFTFSGLVSIRISTLEHAVVVGVSFWSLKRSYRSRDDPKGWKWANVFNISGCC
ncbi:hypothetical protein IFM89_005266 [Coptis chinensis]|uniref:RRM domain-containing protein n=1 Tax=Coptis chinensis TaxID=261450 RepID=A0A835IUQ7_9MAGN|nr:hypothetical protein IFM89_005266 [Coptis chinensis]